MMISYMMIGTARTTLGMHNRASVMIPSMAFRGERSTTRIFQQYNLRCWQTSGSKKSYSAKEGLNGDAGGVTNQSSLSSMWNRFIGPKEMPPRWTAAWYREMVLVCTVFAITGSSTMVVVRPAVSNGLGLHGSMKDGPWSYRICSLVIMTPIYATLLVVVGTVFGRHHYFRHFSVKMWSRFGIPPEMIDASYHQTKQTFRKW